MVGVRGRRGDAPVVGRGRRGERGAELRHEAPARRRRRRRGGEAEGRGRVPALHLLLSWLHGRPLGLHRQVGARLAVVLRRQRVRGSLARRRRPLALNAGVVAEVDDVKGGRVLVGALHLLRRRASLRVPVRAAVVSPAMFARITSGQTQAQNLCLFLGEKKERFCLCIQNKICKKVASPIRFAQRISGGQPNTCKQHKQTEAALFFFSETRLEARHQKLIRKQEEMISIPLAIRTRANEIRL